MYTYINKSKIFDLTCKNLLNISLNPKLKTTTFNCPYICHANSDGHEETAKYNIDRSIFALKRSGFINFWSQTTLSFVSVIILLFILYMKPKDYGIFAVLSTIFSVILGFIGSFWARLYTSMARQISRYCKFKEGNGREGKIIYKKDVKSDISKGIYINIFGLAFSLIGLQSVTGLTVGKALLSSAFNPQQNGGNTTGMYFVALDLFLLQTSGNMLMSHFVSLVSNLWLFHTVMFYS